ncbi:MAG: DUF5654 family protein [Patescibacteria group bacterium]|nr:DUF5654 family protein [Patescibacteria group bacterium]
MKKNNLRSEFLKTMTQLATAGFGLVAALAWNEAIKDFIDHFIKAGSGFISKLIYAIIVTLLAVLVTYFLGKSTQEAKEEEEK